MSPYEEVAVKRLVNMKYLTIGECGGDGGGGDGGGGDGGGGGGGGDGGDGGGGGGGGTHFLNADKLYITSQTKCLVYISSHDKN